MKLPLYAFEGKPDVNSGFASAEIIKYGEGIMALNRELSSGDFKVLEFESGTAYKIPNASINRTFTFQVYSKGGRGTLVTLGDYGDRYSPDNMRIADTGTYINVYFRGGDGGEYLKVSWPYDKKDVLAGGFQHIAVVRRLDTVTIYRNYKVFNTIDLTDENITEAPTEFFGHYDRDLDRILKTYSGQVAHVSHSNDVELPVDYFWRPPSSTGRDVELSFLSERRTIEDITGEKVVDVRIVGDFALIRFRSGQVTALYRPEGTEVGVHITAISKDVNDHYVITTSDGVEHALGEIPSTIYTGLSEEPPGQGYLIDDNGTPKLVPITPGTNVTTRGNKIALTDRYSYPRDYTQSVTIFTQTPAGQGFMPAQSGWQEQQIEMSHSDRLELEYDKDGNALLPHGIYDIEGFVTMPPMKVGQARLVDRAGNVLSYSSLGRNRRPGSSIVGVCHVQFNDRIRINDPTGIKLEMMGVSTIAESVDIGLCKIAITSNINLFKVG